MNNLLPTALVYLSRGYSVIPVGLDKRPLVNWKEFQKRRATVEEITQWFSQNADAQIGIVTGEISDLTVIDIESDGDFNVVKDATFTVETGGKGKHFYFKYEKEFKNAVRIFPSVDVRSEGGYVVAPLSKTSKGVYSVISDVEVARMSSFTKKTFLEANKTQLAWYASSPVSKYPRTNTEGVEYEGQTEGGRNDSMTKFAGSLHAKLHPSLWANIGWQMFQQGNMKNVPPLSPYELTTIWNSIGQREVQQNPGGREYGIGNTREKTWGPAPEKEKIELKPHRFDDALTDSVEEQETQESNKSNNSDHDIPELDSSDTLHASDVAASQVIDTDHTYPLDMPIFDDALLGGFSAGEIIVVAGMPGHGKTTLVQDWSVTLSSGGLSAREKLPSLWFSYEVLAKPLWQKFQGMGATIDTPIYMPRFNESGDMEWLFKVIEGSISKWNTKVVCIDHIGFLRPPKGNYANASDSITHTMRALKRFAVKHGLIIMIPAHVRKTTSKIPDLNDIKDSAGIAQEADTVFFIAREKDDAGLPTQQAKVWLIKNRKGGTSVSATFDFQFGRYYYNANENQKRIEQNSIPTVKQDSKDDDDNW